jgi:hypothetical protein
LFFGIDDPFGVFFKNNSLSEPSGDVIATREYLNTYQSHKYSAFIFGNSRSLNFKNDAWQEKINGEPVYNFSAPGESLLNIEKKLKIILEKQNKINHVIILIDDGILENTENSHKTYQGPVYIHSPLTSNNSIISFYGNYIKYYFSDMFFLKHIFYRTTGIYKSSWMKDAFNNPVSIKQNPSKPSLTKEQLIETNFHLYKTTFNPDYSQTKRRVFYINEKDIVHLKNIYSLLKLNNAHYKIILAPDFHQIKISANVLNTLQTIFGKNVYDFTGKNKITCDSTLNYENLHFTPRAGKIIIDSIYSN